MSVLLKPTAILLLCASLLNAYGDSSGGKIPEVTASAIPVISATSADTLTVTWADMPGDYALTRTGNTEETRTGDVTRTITGNVNESIENGTVAINNNLMGKTVTEMMPAGDYKTEITAMNFETTFVVSGERKEMDMSPKFDAWWMGSLSANYVNPRMALDYGFVSETFAGIKNSNHLAASGGVYVGFRCDFYIGPKAVDTKVHIRKSATSLDQGEVFFTDRKIAKLGYKLTIIG